MDELILLSFTQQRMRAQETMAANSVEKVPNPDTPLDDERTTQVAVDVDRSSVKCDGANNKRGLTSDSTGDKDVGTSDGRLTKKPRVDPIFKDQQPHGGWLVPNWNIEFDPCQMNPIKGKVSTHHAMNPLSFFF